MPGYLEAVVLHPSHFPDPANKEHRAAGITVDLPIPGVEHLHGGSRLLVAELSNRRRQVVENPSCQGDMGRVLVVEQLLEGHLIVVRQQAR